MRVESGRNPFNVIPEFPETIVGFGGCALRSECWVPQSWVESVDDHVMLNKSASEVRSQWHDSAPESIDR